MARGEGFGGRVSRSHPGSNLDREHPLIPVVQVTSHEVGWLQVIKASSHQLLELIG